MIWFYLRWKEGGREAEGMIEDVQIEWRKLINVDLLFRSL